MVSEVEREREREIKKERKKERKKKMNIIENALSKCELNNNINIFKNREL